MSTALLLDHISVSQKVPDGLEHGLGHSESDELLKNVLVFAQP